MHYKTKDTNLCSNWMDNKLNHYLVQLLTIPQGGGGDVNLSKKKLKPKHKY